MCRLQRHGYAIKAWAGTAHIRNNCMRRRRLPVFVIRPRRMKFYGKFGEDLKRFLQAVWVVLLVVATAGVTFMLTVNSFGTTGGSLAAAKTAEVESLLETFFVDEYDPETLADGAAAGMIAATGDEWSYYITADEYASYVEQVNNAYVGIGVTVVEDLEAGGLRVTEVVSGGPADQGGVQVGDVLTHVEGASAAELGQSATVSRVRGEEGTQVTLTFLRDGASYDVTLTRGSVESEVATLEMLDDIALITIDNFDTHCASQTIAAIEQAQGEGARAIVFDVRNNPGGLKDELVELLDYLLPEGVLFRSVDYDGVEEIDESDASYLDMPMAVLVNRDSYSAAEFFAAALQEYDAATIVGTQTYGKGNYQSTFQLSDGSAVAISIGKYYTPNGVSLTGVGITPDVVVELSDELYTRHYYGQLPPEADAQLQAALALFQEST